MTKTILKTVFIIFTAVTLLTATVPGVVANPTQKHSHQENLQTHIERAFTYLETQINQDGGLRWIEETSSVPATIRTILALAANHYPQDYLKSPSGKLPIDFLSISIYDWVNQSDSESHAFNVARAGQLLTAIAAANKNPRHFGQDPVDFIYEINSRYDSTTGVYGDAAGENVTDQVWAILGLAANNASIPTDAIDWLVRAQNEDGSWNDGFGGFLDMTPLAVMALTASDHDNANLPDIQNAIGFLKNNQQNNGGWQTQWDSTTNANTTGLILQAISAVGDNPLDETWLKDGADPFQALLALQKEDGMIGGEYGNAYSTAEALLGLSGQPLYALGYVKRANHAFDYIIESQGPDGGWETIGQTIDVILALRAAGWDPNTITKNEKSPSDYIANNLESYLENGPDALGKLNLGLVASGKNPRMFAGKNPIAMLLETYDPNLNAFGDANNTWHQAMAILGLAAAGEVIPDGAVDTLNSLQTENGGWEYAAGTGIWSDNTALAIQALLAANVSKEDPSIKMGLTYITEMQLEDGSWGDTSTTAFVLMALNALDESSSEWKTENNLSPLPSLLSYQKPNGAFVYSWDYPDDNLMATTASLLALFDGSYLVTPPETKPYTALIIDPNQQGEIITKCIPLNEDTTSGMTLLDSSGLTVDSEGGFINAIEGFKNPKNGTLYWSYWYWDGREWQFYETGAAQTEVVPGSIQAWFLTSWEQFPSKPPTYGTNLSEICGTDVLKNYQAQTYLNYGDLFKSQEGNFIQQGTPQSPQINELSSTESFVTETPDLMGEHTQNEVKLEDEEAEQFNTLPLVILAAFGILLAAFLYFKYIRKTS
ncbi:MAG: prenyltransferase/squalene oxidase repeat-containing protein [Brevefilum sp.]|nr:prenyltransferase/squalene oxidase repeat-containing protein [Brevefilum sp.]MDT8380748.1 prenyltransferase/squalene oxidase repeat-containing protein [Brevefilum sp.]MDW7753665.1 prenyltransferase/squalene oxidase repeat-containing protein [Brevefilum sp.]